MEQVPDAWPPPGARQPIKKKLPENHSNSSVFVSEDVSLVASLLSVKVEILSELYKLVVTR